MSAAVTSKRSPGVTLASGSAPDCAGAEQAIQKRQSRLTRIRIQIFDGSVPAAGEQERRSVFYWVRIFRIENISDLTVDE
jgi:hypothetical protein